MRDHGDVASGAEALSYKAPIVTAEAATHNDFTTVPIAAHEEFAPVTRRDPQRFRLG